MHKIWHAKSLTWNARCWPKLHEFSMIGFGLFGLKFWCGILHVSPHWFIAWGWNLHWPCCKFNGLSLDVYGSVWIALDMKIHTKMLLGLFVFCSFLLELSRGVFFRCDFCIFFMAIQWQWRACNLFWVILSLHWWTWRKTGDFHCLWLPHLIFSVNSWVFRQHPVNTLMLGFFPTYLMVRRRKIALDRAESVIWACF